MSAKKKAEPQTPLERVRNVAIYIVLIACKILRVPSSMLPSKLGRLYDNWSLPMLWMYVKSGGTRIYMDQPCWLKVKSTAPKAQVDPKFALTPEQIESFYKNGFIGPLTACSPEEMAQIRDEMIDVMNRESEAFGTITVRDRHLDSPTIMDLFNRPSLTEPLAQLLGPDLIIWRSQFFNQMPGAPPITWHQASTYMLEDYKKPILVPEDTSQLFQLTTWIALDEANIENGCLHFVPGSHDSIKTIRIGGKTAFYDAYFEMDYQVDNTKVVPMELKPGQFVIFSERTIHGSPGNRSKDKRRCGINFRTITPTTKVYHGQESHYALHLKETWDLKNWGVVTLRGQDHARLNKTFAGFDNHKQVETSAH